jgi:alkylation response protein AidB-like acyl-CoA dehydrogenase
MTATPLRAEAEDFPDLLYSETERALARVLRSLLADRCAADKVLARTELGPRQAYDDGLWQAVAAELGLAGLLIPERDGGAGASYREAAAAAEALGAFVAPVPYLGSAVVATAALVAAGTRDAEDLLRKMADGGVTVALAVPFAAAPGPHGPAFPATVRVAGSRPGDAASGTSRLRGTVRGVADALPAGLLLVPADGVPQGLYLVDAAAGGVAKAPVTSLDMTRQLCDLTLEDAPGMLVASGQGAVRAVQAAQAAGAVILAAEQVGLAERCLDMTVGYVKERRQFARPVGSFQALKHRLADLWVEVAQARAASRYAAACLATASPDAPVAAALAKAYCSQVAVHAAQECVQLHGGIGFTWEHPAHLYLKRAKADSIGFGTPDAHRAALASLVNLPPP